VNGRGDADDGRSATITRRCQEHSLDGVFVKISGSVVFHRDALKLRLPLRSASEGVLDRSQRADAKAQMQLDLDDMWQYHSC
jgi:hypothetical protein